MEIRELNQKDWKEARELYCCCFQKKRKEINEKCLPNHLFGLFLDLELVGMVQIDFLYLHFENQKVAYMNSFCIKEKYQNRGLGDFLLKWCIRYAKDNRADKINMTSNASRIFAHRLYQKNNFVPIDTTVFCKEIK